MESLLKFLAVREMLERALLHDQPLKLWYSDGAWVIARIKHVGWFTFDCDALDEHDETTWRQSFTTPILDVKEISWDSVDRARKRLEVAAGG